MNDLSEFLLARIAEDEAVARAAAGQTPEWVASNEETQDGENVYFTVTAKSGRDWEPDYFLSSVAEDRRDADRVEHIARWDPARVLSECEAKRGVIATLTDVARHFAADIGGGAPWAVTDALQRLALPYADHTDYREEWRP